MSTTHAIGNEAAVEGQPVEEHADLVDEVEERERNLRPSVEQTRQAKIDYADDVDFGERLFGQTLEEEERLAAYEWEIERTRERWDRGQTSTREARCQRVVQERVEVRNEEFAERAGSVDRWRHPEERDPREQLAKRELAVVNREAARVSEHLGGWSRAAVSRLMRSES